MARHRKLRQILLVWLLLPLLHDAFVVRDTTRSQAIASIVWNPDTVRQPSFRYIGTTRLRAGDNSRQIADSSEKTATANQTVASKRADYTQISQIKESIDIVSVIESYGLEGFKRYGPDRATALCPFHDDNKPSFSIMSGQNSMYNCFACGASGDVFKFAMEYNKVVLGKAITFGQAIREVTNGEPLGKFATKSTKLSPAPMTPELLERTRRRQGRILLANVAASEYYSACLRQLSGGIARHYIQKRGLDATSIIKYTIGYAPDAFFNRNSDQKWGDGSLVQHLQSLNFTSDEIIDAGLATLIKPSLSLSSTNNATDSTNTSSGMRQVLIDRFRNRLIVPIFDAKGKYVLAFGARTLENEFTTSVTTTTSEKKAGPKYLNSPETLVFQKKKILYGQHVALQNQSQTPIHNAPPLLLVEGYMDAISVHKLGYSQVVASMGTSISIEQLTAAARLASQSSSRVVLCLDNDDAGHAAVERLCQTGMLSTASNNTESEFYVATLPENISDPSDFMFLYRDNDDRLQLFKDQVVRKALHWKDWYIQQLIKPLKDHILNGDKLKVQDYDALAEFIADKVDRDDWDRKVYEVIGVLSSLVGSLHKVGNVTTSIGSLGDTSPSKLLGRIKHISNIFANARGVGINVNMAGSLKKLQTIISKGEGLKNPRDVDTATLSEQELKRLGISVPVLPKRNAGISRSDSDYDDVDDDDNNDRLSFKAQKKNIKNNKKSKQKAKPQHFQELEFVQETDKIWRESVPKPSYRERMREGPLLNEGIDGKDSKRQKHEKVIFKSEKYLGGQYLSEEAARIGYESGEISSSLQRKARNEGLPSFVMDPSRNSDIRSSTENKLLKLLIQHQTLRSYVKNSTETLAASGDGRIYTMSTSSKQWLYTVLVEKCESIPLECNSSKELLAYLQRREESPIELANHEFSTDSASGALLYLFKESDSHALLLPEQKRTEVEAEEILVSLYYLESCARPLEIVKALQKHSTEADLTSSGNGQIDATTLHQLQDLVDVRREAQRLAKHYDTVKARLCREHGGTGNEGRMLASLQNNLDQAVESHMSTLVSDDDNDRDGSNGDSFEEFCAEKQSEYGAAFESGYKWSAKDIKTTMPIPKHLLRELELSRQQTDEEVDEELAAIEREWKLWID